jgi:site-specific DNA-cytosine methylase
MTLSAMFKAIGNGVPYLAARGIAKMYMKALRKEFT